MANLSNRGHANGEEDTEEIRELKEKVKRKMDDIERLQNEIGALEAQIQDKYSTVPYTCTTTEQQHSS